MQFFLKMLLFGANIALAQVSRQGLYCEQFNDKTTCRENSCAFFAERGLCESLCLVREDTWAFLYQLGSEVMFSSESANEDCMMRCLNTPDCSVYSIFMGTCRIGSAIDESYGWPLVNIEGAVYGECVEQSSDLQIWTPTTHDPTPLPSQSPSSLACEQIHDETTCRENSCAFFAEQGSCESSCLVYEDTWPFFDEIGTVVMVSSDEECMTRCLNDQQCTVYSTFMGNCRIGSDLFQSQEPSVFVAGAVYGICWARFHESSQPTSNPISVSNKPSEMPTRAPSIDNPTSFPSRPACEQFNDETTCRENSCAFFAEQGSCESLCLVREDTWAFLQQIGGEYTGHSDAQCMTRCLNTPDCTVYSTFNGVCRIGSSLDDSFNPPLVNFEGVTYGVCLTRVHEPTTNPTSDQPSAMPIREPSMLPSQSPSPDQLSACQEFKEEMTCRENGCAFFAEEKSCETSCLVHENTWAFLEQIGGEYTGHSDAQCMTRCLNTPDCAVYSIFMEVCRIGSSLDDSFHDSLVNVEGATYGVCSTFLYEPTNSPTSDDPSEMPTRSTTADYPTAAPSYDAPNAEFLNSMGKLLERDPSATRFVKVGRRAGDILQQKKLGDVLHPDVKSAMRTIKSLSKRGFTENRWNKMATQYQTVRAMGY